MSDLIIGGQIINMPSTGQSPVWSDAIIQFAEAVEQVLSGVSGAFDISPQNYNMVADINTDVDIPGLQFPPANVRGANIRYSIYRTTDSGTDYTESGNILINYNSDATSTHKWEISREFIGDGRITFSITDTGQVQFSTTTISGSNHIGQIMFAAQSLLVP